MEATGIGTHAAHMHGARYSSHLSHYSYRAPPQRVHAQRTHLWDWNVHPKRVRLRQPPRDVLRHRAQGRGRDIDLDEGALFGNQLLHGHILQRHLRVVRTGERRAREPVVKVVGIAGGLSLQLGQHAPDVVPPVRQRGGGLAICTRGHCTQVAVAARFADGREGKRALFFVFVFGAHYFGAIILRTYHRATARHRNNR